MTTAQRTDTFGIGGDLLPVTVVAVVIVGRRTPEIQREPVHIQALEACEPTGRTIEYSRAEHDVVRVPEPATT